MKTRKELLAERSALLEEGEAILALAKTENRAMSEAEDARVSEILTLAADIDEALVAHDAQAGATAAIQSATESFAALRAARPANTSVMPRMSAGRIAAPAAKEFENFGEFVHAVAYRQNDQRLASLYQEVNAEMRTDDGPSGGFMLPTQLAATFLEVSAQQSIIRPRSVVLPAGSPPDAAIQIPALDQDTASAPANSFGGVSFSWIGEGGTKPTTDAKMRMIELKPHEIAAALPVTDKLLRNWPAASALIQRLFSGARNAAEELAFLSGDGNARPLGIMNSGAMIKVPRTGAGHIVYADLVGMLAKVLMRDGSPIWMISQSIIPDLMTIKDTNNNFIWAPNAQGGVPQTLLGYPVVINERCEALGTSGDIVLANFGFYLIKDGSGPFFASSEHVDFLANKTWFKMFWNVDGSSWLKAPFKGQKNYTTSPFVALT